MAETVLSSLWDGLSPHLIASFYEVDRDGKRTNTELTVKAPLSESNLEVTLNWQSPFEQAGAESKAPTLFAMLQSGTIQPVIDLLQGKPTPQQTNTFLKQFEGRAGITKLNSVQVFSGMPPVKFQVTAVFRAWKNPTTEVENPFDQLMAWALPVSLARDSTLLTGLIEAAKGSKDWIDGVLPSTAPTLIALNYKGRTYSPLVIEAISQPLNSPIDADGRFVELSVPMTLATLTALDRQDWLNFKGKK
ncbi:MAG: hypothetical protein QX198_17430 [Methylococcaceae bacterium]